MTVFDRLEAQLLAAHPRRRRWVPARAAPRHVLAFAATAAAGAAVAVAGLSGETPRDRGRRAATTSPAAHPSATVPPATTPAYSANATARVTVLNATATPGLAGRVATDLARSGISIGRVTNIPTAASRSRLYYRPGGERTAALVAALLRLGGAAAAPPSLRSFTSVVLVVGRDRIHGPIIVVPRPGRP